MSQKRKLPKKWSTDWNMELAMCVVAAGSKNRAIAAQAKKRADELLFMPWEGVPFKNQKKGGR